MSSVAKLRVKRGSFGESSRYDDFEVPYEDGMSVLDALRWIRIHRDSTLGIRYSCINANACKTTSQCTGGKQCVDEHCVDACGAGGTCGAGLVCIDGGCTPDEKPVFTCTTDGQ